MRLRVRGTMQTGFEAEVNSGRLTPRKAHCRDAAGTEETAASVCSVLSLGWKYPHVLDIVFLGGGRRGEVQSPTVSPGRELWCPRYIFFCSLAK